MGGCLEVKRASKKKRLSNSERLYASLNQRGKRKKAKVRDHFGSYESIGVV
jgi:hypothetical protein